MTQHPITVTAQTSVLGARRLLHAHHVRHLPVVNAGERVVGMVSDRDVLLRDSQVAQALSALQSDLLSGRYRRVETIMTAPVHTVAPDEPVSLAANLMLCWQVSGLPVVDHGRLVGIITTTDCLRALLSGLDQDARRRREPGLLEGDPDWRKITPMPPGDDRPGRPVLPQPARVEAAYAVSAASVRAPVRTDGAAAGPSTKQPAGVAG
jgi:CBS domain-containing protein